MLLGLGMGGFFDGIVFHQILQWHHMLSSAGYPTDSVDNLKLNTLADGLFHACAYIFVMWGVGKLWAASRQPHFRWSSGLLAASMLMGFGLFNIVEGLVNHQILGIHHVNETVPRAQWIYWDVMFLAWGVAMLAGGSLLKRHQQSSLQNLLATGATPDESAVSGSSVNLSSESVAGEEDPGASLDMLPDVRALSVNNNGGSEPVSQPPGPLNPGDEAPAGTPGTGEGICRECGGSGRAGAAVCRSCNGSGKVTVGVGGA